MAAWTQSHFLQALGWATINSIWQMALLWAFFWSVSQTFKLSSARRYQGAVGAMLLGFAWFISTFIFYYLNHSSSYAFFENTVVHSNRLLNILLLSASVTYLLLLVFPAVRLFRNWQFVKTIRHEGKGKAQLEYRLFVQKVAFLLGITRKVKVAVSSMVSSPVTVGYLKPIILLPVAAMNQLTTAQVEAILLHELSHIRRYDYLLNFVVSVIYTLLYFNPFVKSFMTTIEAEREACCDEVVLQFGYDKVGYASALLHLEKLSGRHHALALAAAGKQNLLHRIEKIVGMEKKKTFRVVQVIPLFMAMFCVLLFNSVLIIKDAKTGASMSYASTTLLTPWQLDAKTHPLTETGRPMSSEFLAAKSGAAKEPVSKSLVVDIYQGDNTTFAPDEPSPVLDHLIPVGFDEVDGRLSAEEKEDVKKTVEATKKVASTLQWKEIEKSIGDAMNSKEKALAHQEYQFELNKLNWKNVEQNLKVNYENLNWAEIKQNVNEAMAQVEIDSLHTIYSQAICELEKAQKQIRLQTRPALNPLPDASLAELQKAKETLKKNLDSLKEVKCGQKKVISL